MNKKLLLSTTIAGTMLFVGMSNSLAVSNVRVNQSWVDSQVPSIAIELDKGETKLSEEALKEILNKKFYNDCVASISKSVNNNNVGTGSVINLTNGSSYTLVLFGDVDGDGSIGPSDATAILNHRAGEVEISSLAALKAADVASAAGVGASDAQRIMQYRADGALFSAPSAPTFVDLDRLPGDEILAVLGFDADFVTGNQTAATTNGDVEVNGTSIDVKVKRAELLSSYRDAKYADWLALDLTQLPANCTWTVSGVDFERFNNLPRVYVDGSQDTTTFTLTVNGEVVTITVNILDISEPEVVSVVKAENAEYTDEAANGALIDKVEAAGATSNPNYTAMTVTTNVNRMEESEFGGHAGNWYKVRVKVKDLNTSLIRVVDADDTRVSYKAEIIDEDELYVWLDATVETSNLAFVSVNATKAQLGQDEIAPTYKVPSTYKAKAKTTVKVNNTGVLKLAGVGVASGYGDVQKNPQSFNQYNVKIAEEGSNSNTIVVQAPLRDLKSYVFAESSKEDIKQNNYAPKLKSGEGKYEAQTTDEFVTEGGHKYYGLLVDLNYLAENIAGNVNDEVRILDVNSTTTSFYWNEGRDPGKVQDWPNQSVVKTGEQNKTVLLWLDAEQKETVFNIYTTKDIDTDREKYPEHFKFTVKFVDTSAPIVYKAEKNNNADTVNVDPNAVTVATESTLGTDYATNSKAVTVDTWSNKTDTTAQENNRTIAVKARKSAMNAVQRDSGKTLWYALKVKVNVNREDLVFTKYQDTVLTTAIPCKNYIGEVTGLADDEIVLWVDANKASQEYELKNINETGNTVLKLKVETEDVSLAKVTDISVTSVNADSVDLGELPGYGSEFAANVANNTNTAKGVVSVDDTQNQSATTGKALEDGKVRILQANTNLLKEFSFRLGTGKWIPLVLELNTTVNVKVEGNIATNEERLALGLNTMNTTVLWVDANTLKATNNEVTIHTIDNANSGLVETHTFSFDFKDNSAFVYDEGKLGNTELGFDIYDKEYRESHDLKELYDPDSGNWGDKEVLDFYSNMLQLETPTVERDENKIVITVEGDYKSMKDLSNGTANPVGKVITLLVDLGSKVNLDNAVNNPADKYWVRWHQQAQGDKLVWNNWVELTSSDEREDSKKFFNATSQQFYFTEKIWNVPEKYEDGDTIFTRYFEVVKANSRPSGDQDGEVLSIEVHYIQKTISKDEYNKRATEAGLTELVQKD